MKLPSKASPGQGSVKKSRKLSEYVLMTHCSIYHTWPETKNAEYENILRIIDAAKNIGLDITVTDNQGYPLFSTVPSIDENHSRLTRNDCDFAVSLHFESPKLNDIYTYYALWNPLEFYFVWGYAKSIRQFASHDDLLSCDSDLTEAHALNIYHAMRRCPLLPLPRLHHSLSHDVLAPRITDKARAFYIGINWERINNTKGRHHELLVALDEAGLIDIYGPELFHGVKPWENYKSYRGSVPFDGKSTIERIAESGICLAFSSAAHQSSGVMSNRLFEGLAAGALVLANKHPFLDKFFGEHIFIIDDSLPVGQVISEVKRIIYWARDNPGAAIEKAQAAQRIFLDHFALEGSLARLVEVNESRKASWARPEEGAKSITAVIVCTDLRLSRLEAVIQGLADQTHPVAAATLIVDATWYRRNQSKIQELLRQLAAPTEIIQHEIFAWEDGLGLRRRRKHLIGPAVWQALLRLETDYFFLQRSEEDIFADHLARLVRVAMLERKPGAISGVILESLGGEGRFNRRLEWLAPPNMDHIVFCNEERYTGNALFEHRVVPLCDSVTFSLSDGQEHNLLKTAAFVAGGLAYTNSASYVFREQDRKHSIASLIPIEHQHQFIRDATQAKSAWLDAARQYLPPMALLNQSDGSQGFWSNLSRPGKTGLKLKPGERYSLSEGDGKNLVAGGFHSFEADGVWIDGLFGTLEFTLDLAPGEIELFKKVRFEIGAQGRRQEGTGRKEHTTVIVNGAAVGYFEVSDEWGMHVLDVSRNILHGDPNVRLQFRLDHAETVMDDKGEVIDERKLGMRVATLAVYLL